MSYGKVLSNGAHGAACTLELKKKSGNKLEKELGSWDGQVWGFDYEPKEINRAIRLKQQYPDTKPLFPLIEKQITKPNAMGMLWKAGIKIPAMYKMGYNNNNSHRLCERWHGLLEQNPEGLPGGICSNGTD